MSDKRPLSGVLVYERLGTWYRVVYERRTTSGVVLYKRRGCNVSSCTSDVLHGTGIVVLYER